MPSNEDSSNYQSRESELESMVETLQTETPSAPEIKVMVKDEDKVAISSTKATFKSREAILTGIDDLLISRGARLILFLPIVVVLLFGLAQSYRGSEPDWWEGGVQELFLAFSFSKSVYLLALTLMVTDLVLLFVLHYLL
ncbi:MAG: hypothetical protein CBD24_00950, partial [Euryarchaeota archaeon TMED164]